MRMWWKRCAPSRAGLERRTSCFCASVVSSSSTRARRPGARAATATSGEHVPTTEAGSMTARSLALERVEPRASSAWIVGGTLDLRQRLGDRHAAVLDSTAPLVDEHARATARRTAGCPRRLDDARPVPRASSGRRRAGSRSCARVVCSPSGSRTTRSRRSPCSIGRLLEQLGPRGQRTRIGASDACRRAARAGRAASARPSGCPRRRGRRAARGEVLEQPPHRPEHLLRPGTARRGRAPRRAAPSTSPRRVGERGELRRAPPSRRRRSTIPAACLTASAIGQNVMPSP